MTLAHAISLAAAVSTPAVAWADDRLPPTVTHDICRSHARGAPFDVLARMVDDSPLFEPLVFYRSLMSATWKRAAFAPHEGSLLRAVIPGEDLSAPFEYFIEAFDADGNGPARVGTPDEALLVDVTDAAEPCGRRPAAPVPATNGFNIEGRLEPGAAVLVTGPPDALYSQLGGGVTAKASISPAPLTAGSLVWFAGQVHAGWLGFAAEEARGAGGATLVGAGVRLASFVDSSWPIPYVDANLGLAHTGPLNRLAFDGALGVDIDFGGQRLGPFIKYTQIFDSESRSSTGADALIFLAGVAAALDFDSTPDAESPQLVGVFPPTVDADVDRRPLVVDECLDAAEDWDGFRDHDGCPEPDNDEDGRLDAVDRCPNQPEDSDGFADDDGCPDPDNDADGLVDAKDGCPSEAEDFDGTLDDDGCPDPDNDADGIADAADACPTRAEDRDGFEDGDGCPEADNDGDGVLDLSDRCPDAMETMNGVEDDDGCPDAAKAKAYVDLSTQKIVIKERIYFATGSHKLARREQGALDAVVRIMKELPKIGRISIEGHTDDRGSDELNDDLSLRRAQSIMAYMVKNGVPAERLEARGFGRRRPLVPGSTDEAREVNRRVEFVMLDAPQPDGAQP